MSFAEFMETVDFAMFESFFGTDGAYGAYGAAGTAADDGAYGPDDSDDDGACGTLGACGPDDEYDAAAFVEAAWSAFETALGDFVERTCEETHRTLELAVALLTRLDGERAAKARERTDLVNAIKNASVILYGPMIDS
jgi:hypothetical protein